MTIKLEEKTIELGGKTYVLHVNMSVLDRLQEAHDGNIGQLMKNSLNQAMTETMAAMLNDWCEDQGWEQDWTAGKVKKYFTLAMLRELDVIGMLFRAMTPAKSKEKIPAGSEEGKAEITDPEKSGN